MKKKPHSNPKCKKQWFSKAVMPLYTSTNKVCIFQLLHIQHLWSVIFKIILILCISYKKIYPFKGTVWRVFTNVYTYVTTAIAKAQKILISPKSCHVPLCSQSSFSALSSYYFAFCHYRLVLPFIYLPIFRYSSENHI